MAESLLSFQIPTIKGSAELKKGLQSLPAEIQVIKVSSIYKKYANQRMEDLNSFLLCVVHIKSELDPWEINDRLTQLEGKWTLLAHGSLISLTPAMPLPNPSLYEDPALLRCASEAWGGFEHPVLGQCLNELVRSVHSFGNVEFFAQGRSIL